ncbi:MAG: endonuclease III [Planctomycetota bacterium]
MIAAGRARRKTLSRIIALLEKDYGAPRRPRPGPLLDILIRTVLSQNTSDVNSDRAYRGLKMRFPAWGAVLGARRSAVERSIRCGGLAHTKAGHIQGVLRWLKRERGGLSLEWLRGMTVEEAVGALEGLSGIGLKTITVVLLFGCGADICPVDTHVHRLVRRIGLVEEKAGRNRTFWLLGELVPRGKGISLHLNLIEHGRRVCKALRPRCAQCPILADCEYGLQRGRKRRPTGERRRTL